MILSWIIIIIALIFIYKQYKKYDGKPAKYLWSSILLILGILFIEPSLDPISFTAFSVTHGMTLSSINLSNISSVLLKYEIWSISIGLIMIIASGLILGKSWNHQFKKLNVGKYNLALMIALASVLLISLLHIFILKTGNLEFLLSDSWTLINFNFILILFLIAPAIYWKFYHKDKSEFVGIYGFSLIMFLGGLHILGEYIFQGLNLPLEMPVLSGNGFINFINKNLGYSFLTNISLLISICIALVCSWLFAKVLKERF